mmetsp:Transcript_1670/g.7453  ORF Transcript_1670/g.7453 Transcript_1670/m.7453 type:complete len:368 (+) Transcript_1670:237-1340(+)
MLKVETSVRQRVNSDAVPRVVEHAHDVPRRSLRHGVLRLVERSEANLVAPAEPVRVNLELPVAPAPVPGLIAGGTRGPSRLFPNVDVGELPGLALVEGELRSDHFSSAAAVRVPFQLVRLGGRVENFFVLGVDDGAVDVEVVDDVLGLEPPALVRGELRIDAHGKHAVVVEVVEVLGLLVGDDDLAEELDHATADVPRDQHAARVAVVGVEFISVLFVRDDDVARRVQRGLHVDGCAVRTDSAVLAVVTLGKFTLGAGEAHEPSAGSRLVNPRAVQDEPERDTLPVRVPHGGGSPVEPDGLLDHVLFLAPVTRAHHQAREAIGRHLRELVHADGVRVGHVPGDFNRVGVPVELWHGAVVADDVQVDW